MKQYILVHEKTSISPHGIDSYLLLTSNCRILNSDGVINLISNMTSFGGMLRKLNGEWILSYNHFLEVCSVFEALLWEILNDLTLV